MAEVCDLGFCRQSIDASRPRRGQLQFFNRLLRGGSLGGMPQRDKHEFALLCQLIDPEKPRCRLAQLRTPAQRRPIARPIDWEIRGASDRSSLRPAGQRNRRPTMGVAVENECHPEGALATEGSPPGAAEILRCAQNDGGCAQNDRGGAPDDGAGVQDRFFKSWNSFQNDVFPSDCRHLTWIGSRTTGYPRPMPSGANTATRVMQFAQSHAGVSLELGHG